MSPRSNPLSHITKPRGPGITPRPIVWVHPFFPFPRPHGFSTPRATKIAAARPPSGATAGVCGRSYSPVLGRVPPQHRQLVAHPERLGLVLPVDRFGLPDGREQP